MILVEYCRYGSLSNFLSRCKFSVTETFDTKSGFQVSCADDSGYKWDVLLITKHLSCKIFNYW